MSANDIAGGDRTGRSFQGLVRELRDRLAGFRKARPAAYGRFLGITLVVVAAISFTLAVTNLIYAQAAHSSGKPYKIEISPESQADMKPVVEAFIKTSAGGRVVLSSDGRADVFIAARPSAGYEAIKVTGMPSG
jgi:hypothetical protein